MTARSQHRGAYPQNLTSIVREALRAAALSDRPNDAIDVLGDALRHLADLAHMEGRRHAD